MKLLIVVLLLAIPAAAQTVDPSIPVPVTLHYLYRNSDGTDAGEFAVAVSRAGEGYIFNETSAKRPERVHRFDRTMIPLVFRFGAVEMVRNARGYDVSTPEKRALLEADTDSRIFYSIFFMLMGYDFAARKPLEFTPVDYRALNMPKWKRSFALPRLRVTYAGSETVHGVAAHHLRLDGAGMLGGAFPGYDLWYATAAPHYLLRTKPGSAHEQAVVLERVE